MVKIKAPDLVATWLAERRHTRVWLARQLGVHPSNVYRWLSGTWRPSHEHILAIERLTGIAASHWLTRDEQRAIKAIAPDTTPATVAAEAT